ncbi:hypothetical protein [Agrobacterium sp. NPDC089420]|uniref:hypothetical protein n=1 Tax=Agrobacterium sp. NPDC089420 TaxID=3363918 RepID=UPI0038500F8D
MKQRFDDKSIGAKRRVPKKKILPDPQRKHFLQNSIPERRQSGTKFVLNPPAALDCRYASSKPRAIKGNRAGMSFKSRMEMLFHGKIANE